MVSARGKAAAMAASGRAAPTEEQIQAMAVAEEIEADYLKKMEAVRVMQAAGQPKKLAMGTRTDASGREILDLPGVSLFLFRPENRFRQAVGRLCTNRRAIFTL